MNEKTIQVVGEERCTGCGACFNKCPVDAIQMKKDNEGFMFPKIIENKCIGCGACLKACPVIMPDYSNEENPGCFALMASNDIRAKSSSGGAFSLLAKWILEQGGVVCGASLNDDCYGASHIVIDKMDQLHRLRGSKYVQSDTNTVYRQIRDILKSGRNVLFTGTPCQVAGIKHFMGKPYENLYTVDLVCHGVPSGLVLEQFIKEKEKKYGSKAASVSFRDKSIVPWNAYSMAIEFEDGQRYFEKRDECAYMRAFFKLIMLRKSCGKCPFAALPRQGDVTLADFWDIHRYDERLDDQKGTSMVLANSAKGKHLLSVLESTASLMEKAPLEHAIRYNAQVKFSPKHHPERERFFELLTERKFNFDKAADWAINRKFDIGYIGWWYGENYGSILTNYAMNRVLNNLGKSVLMIDFPVKSGPAFREKINSRARRFGSNFYNESIRRPLSEHRNLNWHCDTFVVGSDQLWNWWSNSDIGSYYYFLDFVDDKHKKIAYSTSFGHDSGFYPDDMRLKIGYYLSRFDAVSVREFGGVKICRQDYNVDAVQTLDPVFLCGEEDYKKAIRLAAVKPQIPFILAYILNPTEDKLKAIRKISSEKKLGYYIILDGQGNFDELKKQVDDPNIVSPPEFADWLCYFYYSSYIVTDSFHGFCLSILFKKEMVIFPNSLRGLSRFETLGKLTELSDRFVYSYDELIEKGLWNVKVSFQKVYDLLTPHIEFSKQWLQNALEMRKKNPSIQTLMLKRLIELENK